MAAPLPGLATDHQLPRINISIIQMKSRSSPPGASSLAKPIPIIDLFAGPGGLGEGFSSLQDESGNKAFDVRVSIEKDPVAHRTLSLRAMFRSFPKGQVPDCYYDYIKGDITRDAFLAHPAITDEVRASASEARNATLGETPQKDVDKWIADAIGDSDPWVLIGGPPCQAYSVAGRSRMRGKDPEAFEGDKRHFLYKEYLRIINRFGPAMFVMENVKGMLSSTHGGNRIFEQILSDLTHPGNDLGYEIRSFVVKGTSTTLNPNDYIIESELFGVPQMRHRVILLGVRRDMAHLKHDILVSARSGMVSALKAISGLPALRSRLSQEPDSYESWLSAVKEAPRVLKGWRDEYAPQIRASMETAALRAEGSRTFGGRFVPSDIDMDPAMPKRLRDWYHDSRLGGTTLHETRRHMRSDIHRYLFASCYASEFIQSPKLADFPPALLPAHENVGSENVPFKDRFRVQVGYQPATTVVSHIAKDGHYYIHPVPSQCRSLTVREAARLQTFPDNYFFEGSRTEQYTQVGNAVPPYLAHQVARVVFRFLARASADAT